MSKLNKCICGNCKHFKTSDCPFYKAIFEVCKDDTCEDWEDDNKPIKNTKVTFLRLDKGE